MAYPISRFWLFYTFRILIRQIKGLDNIPTNLNFIVVSNHEKLADPFIIIYPLLRKLNKKIHFIATPTWWFLGETICRKWIGCIPMFNQKQAYIEAKKLINSGEIVGIFPEGHLEAKVRNPKTGAIRLALETNAPILPIGLKSSYIPFNSTLNIGKLIYLKKNKKNLKKQASDLMKKVYQLSGSKI
ncbi:1-acyl-sn-glycerol-3-phosphate acyltransferase [Candidatus Woesearchaeota archaeon]|nr:1-acyl-sn-glycerol-3-phosphate acyltransferase [Candidatus Woesearchaeota archaeon]